MLPAYAIPAFLASLVVALVSAAAFARALDRLGVKVGLAEPLLGLLTALAADGPEIASVIVALLKGATGVSVGVVVGSNVFNLAAMLGLTALVAGGISLRPEALAVEAVVALSVTVVAAAVVVAALPPAIAVALVVCVLAPYVVLLTRGRSIALRLPLPARVDRGLARALSERGHWGGHGRVEHAPVRTLLAVMVPAVAFVVLGSIGMVETAVSLADRWGFSPTLVGVLLLAPLTSIPNAYTGMRLGRAGRGAALVSETLNSNTINLVAGLVVPALVISVGTRSGLTVFDFGCLLLMSLAAVAMLARRRGMGRLAGAVLLIVYVIFCAVELATA
jgi:cation:H+ antiporter